MSFLVERGSSKQRHYGNIVQGWLLMFGVWTFVGVLLALTAYPQSIGPGRALPFPWWWHLAWTLAQCYVLWGLTPLIVTLGRRFPFDPGRWPRALPVYAALTLFFPLASSAIFALIYWMLGLVPGPFKEFAWVTVIARFPVQALVCFAILAVAQAVDYYRKLQEQGFQLARARLDSLRGQLHPHFLFNTLNAISELIYRDPQEAERAIINLSDLLRSVLDNGDVHLVPLKDELDFLHRYVEIHRAILQGRLVVEFKIEPETTGVSVPTMILQPMVENAIRHGIDPVSRAGRIEISAARDCGALRLTVSDNGPGLPEQGQAISRKGIGLSNTQARLAQLYGKAYRFELKSAPGQGLTVNLFIPLEER
ncbi:MAG TPA: histidine kinase [Blastocatellia bacterium]|jgi:signal transduction histidine kinase|nr:histidine kinase [Blastocatellia bacterium]